MAMIVASLVQLGMMIGVPVALGFFFRKKLGERWGLWLAGALTFVGSQVVHIPLNWVISALSRVPGVPRLPQPWMLPVNCVVLGLTAGLCEEIARYVTLKAFLKKDRSWNAAVMFGAGHGGIESIILGVLVALTFVSLLGSRGLDAHALQALGVSAGDAATAIRQIRDYWATPFYLPLLAGLERFEAMTFHVSMACLVTYGVARRKLWALPLAIALHAFADGAAVYVAGIWGKVAAEALIPPFVALSVLVLVLTRRALAREATAVQQPPAR